MDHAIILFDGVCNFCNSSVNFIIDRDSKDYFRFGALQSDEGQALLKQYGLSQTAFDTLILIEGDKIYTRSTAALRIAKKLSGSWPLFYDFIVIPAFIRDPIYAFIAKHRYKIFGKKEVCRIPTAAERARFI
jgi:predicted DCC family thiol-disulfide oxidoreductase YuxK